MITLAIGVATGLVIMNAAFRSRRDSQRVRALVPAKANANSVGPTVIIGRAATGAPFVRRHVRTAEAQAQVGVVLVLVVPVFVVSRKLACLVALGLVMRPALAKRRRRKIRDRLIARELPIAADLLRLCVASGMNVTNAVGHVATHLTGPIGAELALVKSDVRRGLRLADALDAAGARLGEEVRPLLSALVSSERYGAPLSDVLERMATEARRSQERRAEQAARLLSVQLLFPVAGTILPAFALLTVAPLLAGSIGSSASFFH